MHKDMYPPKGAILIDPETDGIIAKVIDVKRGSGIETVIVVVFPWFEVKKLATSLQPLVGSSAYFNHGSPVPLSLSAWMGLSRGKRIAADDGTIIQKGIGPDRRSLAEVIAEVKPDAVKNPKPGDYWSERLTPIAMVVGRLGPDAILVCTTVKRLETHSEFDLTTWSVFTQDAFENYVQHLAIFDRGKLLEDACVAFHNYEKSKVEAARPLFPSLREALNGTESWMDGAPMDPDTKDEKGSPEREMSASERELIAKLHRAQIHPDYEYIKQSYQLHYTDYTNKGFDQWCPPVISLDLKDGWVDNPEIPPSCHFNGTEERSTLHFYVMRPKPESSK